MKATIYGAGDFWVWAISKGTWLLTESKRSYTRRRDAKRGLLRFLKGMKKGVEVVE